MLRTVYTRACLLEIRHMTLRRLFTSSGTPRIKSASCWVLSSRFSKRRRRIPWTTSRHEAGCRMYDQGERRSVGDVTRRRSYSSNLVAVHRLSNATEQGRCYVVLVVIVAHEFRSKYPRISLCADRGARAPYGMIMMS